MMVATVARLLTGVLLFVLLARAWGPSEFGLFMYCYTVASIAVMVVDFGFGLQTVRDISRRPGRVAIIMARSLAGKAALTAMLAGLYPVWTRWLPGGSGYAWLLPLLLGASVVNSFALHLNYAFRAVGRFDLEARVALGANIALFAGVALGLTIGVGLVGTGVAFVLARILHLVMSRRVYARILGRIPLQRASWSAVVQTLRKGLPFGVHVVVGTLYFQVDTLIVQQYVGTVGVGLFQAGARVMLAALVLPEVISNVYLPPLAAAPDAQSALRIGTRMTRQLMTMGVAALAVMVLCRELIVRVLYGAGFAGVTSLLPLFALVVVIRYAGSSVGLLLTTGDRQRTRSLAIVAAMVVSIGVNLLLVPRYRLTGAVVAAIATNAFLAGTYMLLVLAHFRRLPLDQRGAALGVIGALMFSASFIHLHWIVVLPTLLLIAAVGIAPEDLAGLRRRFGALTTAPA